MDDKSKTKQKLILAACTEFANMGYQNARIREISSASGTNLAAVNYHFGSKANLYLATLDYVFGQGQSNYDMSLPENMTPAVGIKILTQAINHFMTTLNKDGIQVAKSRILYREIREPSEVYDQVYARIIQPRMEYMEKLLNGIYGKKHSPEEVKIRLFMLLGIFSFYANSGALVTAMTQDTNFLEKNHDAVVKAFVQCVTA